MRTKIPQIAKAYRLPKVHKQFVKVASFRLIADTTNTPHYIVAKFPTNHLNSLI